MSCDGAGDSCTWLLSILSIASSLWGSSSSSCTSILALFRTGSSAIFNFNSIFKIFLLSHTRVYTWGSKHHVSCKMEEFLAGGLPNEWLNLVRPSSPDDEGIASIENFSEDTNSSQV